MIMIKMLMLVVLLLLTQVVKTTLVNIMDQNNYPLEVITYTYHGRSTAEEDDLTADLLQIHSLLQRVMQRQNIIMDQENYICKACRQPEIVTTVHSYSYEPNPAMQYVKSQQQLYNNKWKGKEIISIHADSPFHFKEQSDLTLRTMIGAGRKNTRPKKLIRLKGKRISNHLHNNQLHSKLREISKLLKTRGELLNRPISSLEILSQVNHDESDTQGLTLVRRKKRKTRRKWKGRGFMSLLGYH
jgi:hypothetical protein